MASIDITPNSFDDFAQGIPRSYPKQQLIQSEALLKSIELLSKLEYHNNGENQSIINKKCAYCNNMFPTAEGRDYSCKACNEILCIKHRDLLNHHCEKVSPSLEKYLMAKNTFKTKLREIKTKGHS